MYAGVPMSMPVCVSPIIYRGLAREPEVHDDRLRAAVLAALDEHVARLEIAVDDAEPVRLVDREAMSRNTAIFSSSAIVSAARASGSPATYWKRDVRAAADLADLVDMADPGMIDAGLGTRLAHEPHRERRVCRRG